MKRFDSRDLEAALPRLWDVDDASWTRYRAAKDPLHEKITDADAARLAEAASARAALAYGRFGGGASAESLGVAVVDEPVRPGQAPPFLSLAEKKPPRIRLSAGALAEIGRIVAVHGLADKAGDEALWRRMLTAHELYHHLEWTDPEAFRPTETIVQWRLAGFVKRAIPMCASEMAAMTFSRLATGNAFQPDIIELLFLAGRSPEVALGWMRVALGEHEA